MKPKAQPLRITAGTEPAKSGFIRGDFGGSAKTVHLGDGRVQVRDAKYTKNPEVGSPPCTPTLKEGA
jgi:hypothetical protein